MRMIAWANGRFVDPSSPLVAPIAYGLTIGQGLFETCAVYHGRIFGLNAHLSRLAASSHALGLGAVDTRQLAVACRAVAGQLSEASVARLRLTVTSGIAGLGVLGVPQHSDVTVLAQAVSGPKLGEINSVPATLATSAWTRNENSPVTGHKVTSYLDNALALRQASEKGATEVLLCNSKADVSEGATSNIIFDLGGSLVTPALSSGCLPGITREYALRWAARAGLQILEATPGQLTQQTVSELPAALLGTLRNVQLVSHLDGSPLPHSDKLTDLQELFAHNMAEALESEA